MFVIARVHPTPELHDDTSAFSLTQFKVSWSARDTASFGFVFDPIEIRDHVQCFAVLVVNCISGHCFENFATKMSPASAARAMRVLLGETVVCAVAVDG